VRAVPVGPRLVVRRLVARLRVVALLVVRLLPVVRHRAQPRVAPRRPLVVQASRPSQQQPVRHLRLRRDR